MSDRLDQQEKCRKDGLSQLREPFLVGHRLFPTVSMCVEVPMLPICDYLCRYLDNEAKVMSVLTRVNKREIDASV